MKPSGIAIIVVIIVAILLFAAPKLPQLAKSIGQSMRIFKNEVDEMENDSQQKKLNKKSDEKQSQSASQSTDQQSKVK